MRSDVPAALPLISYAAGLALGHSYAEAIGLAAVAVLLIALRIPRAALVCLALAGGVCAAAHARATLAVENAAIGPLIADRFVTVVAPIDRDWSARGEADVLRCEEQIRRGRALLVQLETPLEGVAAALRLARAETDR